MALGYAWNRCHPGEGRDDEKYRRGDEKFRRDDKKFLRDDEKSG